MKIKDIKIIDHGSEHSVAIEFATGEVRTITARQLYEATRAMGQDASGAKTAAQRRAEELLALRRNRR